MRIGVADQQIENEPLQQLITLKYWLRANPVDQLILAEGVYFCTMRAGDFTATERIVVLK